MTEKYYTTGDIARAADTSRRHAIDVLLEMSIPCELTEGGHRRFTEIQAKALIKAIKSRRAPRYVDLI